MSNKEAGEIEYAHATGLLGTTGVLEYFQPLTTDGMFWLVLFYLCEELFPLLAFLPLLRKLVGCSRDPTSPAILGNTFRWIGQRGQKICSGLTRSTVPATTGEELSSSIARAKIDLPTLVQDYDFVENLSTPWSILTAPLVDKTYIIRILRALIDGYQGSRTSCFGAQSYCSDELEGICTIQTTSTVIPALDRTEA